VEVEVEASVSLRSRLSLWLSFNGLLVLVGEARVASSREGILMTNVRSLAGHRLRRQVASRSIQAASRRDRPSGRKQELKATSGLNTLPVLSEQR